MQRKKDLVRAVHNRREPQRHLWEKMEIKNSKKLVMKSREFLWNSLRKLQEKFYIIQFPKNSENLCPSPENFSEISGEIFCRKELSFCHKLKFFNLYIYVTG